ncbi:MAG TPA: TauD/TfdA family dioxygenase [Polyangiaceae bacterium]|nr:TauD/TfdA family dioxygenase [Polyangiaceae bacterium]
MTINIDSQSSARDARKASKSEARALPFELKRLEPTLGGEVRNLDLHRELDATTVAALRAALLERKVLVFRGAGQSPEELERFARYFGEPFGSPDYAYGHYEGFDHIVKIGPSPVGQRPSNWHQGGTWKANPWAFELLQLAVVPPVGGATLYADLQAAYRALSEPFKKLVGGLRAAHSTEVKPSSRGRHDDKSFVDHPLVLTHPETGEKGLYLTSRITHLLDVPRAESEALLAFLRQHASGVSYQYRNHWSAGDLVIWDNRSVWHYAVDDYGDQERWGLKISIEGGDWRPQ